MPKIKEQVKKSQQKPEEKPTPQKLAEPKVVIYRLFECVVHLEEAANQIRQVGILPGPDDKANVFQTKLKLAKAAVDDILKDYLTVWGEMQKC